MFAPSEIRIDKAGQEPFSPRAYEEREKNIPSRIRRNVKKALPAHAQKREKNAFTRIRASFSKIKFHFTETWD